MKSLKWHSKTFLIYINVNYSNNENFPLLLEILKPRISNLEKELIEKDAIINFHLKQKNEIDNNTSSINKTVTEMMKYYKLKEEQKTSKQKLES